MSLAQSTMWYDEHHRRAAGEMRDPEPPQTPWSRVIVALCVLALTAVWAGSLIHYGAATCS